MEGWIKLHRKFITWEWFSVDEMVKLFLYLLLKANHEAGQWHGIEIKRGQLITGLKSLSQSTNISMQSLRTCLLRLKSTNEITIKSTNKYSIITICNYDIYQSEKNITNKQLTIKSTNDQQTTNNKQEEEELKEEILFDDFWDKNKKDQYDFISKFNELTGKKIRVFDKKAKSQFDARIKEGFTTDDIETAIKNCKKDKFHIENPKYLTPEFITRTDKLQMYLNNSTETKAKPNYRNPDEIYK